MLITHKAAPQASSFFTSCVRMSATEEDQILEGAKKRVGRRSSTGVLETLPRVPAASALCEAAARAARKIKADPKIKNQRQQARKMAAQRMDAFGKEISQPLSKIIKQYESSLSNLHPFEATLADLTVRARAKRGHRTFLAQLGEVNELRKEALRLCKAAAGAANRADSKKEALEGMEAGECGSSAGAERHPAAGGQTAGGGAAVAHRRAGGAPNVGKSSIVRSISTGTPEVNNYPFTTRGMTMGHLYHPATGQKAQVMDTPGVLSRPDSERNEMEALTLASMQHLPTAVMFVMDMSGLSGEQSSIEKQIEVRNELRARFPRRPWVDVVSKADLPRHQEEILNELNWGHHSISVKTGEGVEVLCDRVIDMLEEVEQVLNSLGIATSESN
eukprot:CAMPEP_0206412346 /NCGR_PEP_ID=MMETSP0294-20121207/33928_1 /ASSEMBLY_ACC=CAM_ASM_000327 /TAXON_ID=39354 /ORGANISM="Heterosigma akashiwo, Strain CCMP2393" /LENGTH=388 /DNA_ID=CAMNT_0053873455 /DNA_START=93 /DNA_END=1260 /DNA_ORIENTATION=-